MSRAKLRAAIVAAAVLLSACTAMQRNEMLDTHPEWNFQDRSLIRQGKIRKGFTKDQVLAAWGNPCVTCRGNRRRSWGDMWEYRGHNYVWFDTAGRVEAWSTSQ